MSAGDHGIPPAPRIEGAEHIHSGKVRDLYRLPGGELLMVASDRISAYDFVLESTIPDKGAVLTQMSLWWFEQLADLVPNHVRSTSRYPPRWRDGPWSARASRCSRSSASPVATSPARACASTTRRARSAASPCPTGWSTAAAWSVPIFTPATKAELGDHDENVSFAAVVGRGRAG